MRRRPERSLKGSNIPGLWARFAGSSIVRGWQGGQGRAVRRLDALSSESLSWASIYVPGGVNGVHTWGKVG